MEWLQSRDDLLHEVEIHRRKSASVDFLLCLTKTEIDRLVNALADALAETA